MLKPYVIYTAKHVWKQKEMFIPMMGFMLLDTIARLAQPFLYKTVVDTLTNGLVAKAFSDESLRYLMTVIAIWFLLAVCNNVFNSQFNFLGWKLGNVISNIVHLEGFKRLLRLDYHEHTKKHSSQLAKLVDDADTGIWDMINWWTRRFIPGIVGFVGMMVIAFSVNWQMTLVSLSVIPPGLAMIFFMVKKYEDRQHEINRLWREKHEHLSDQVANIVTYKLNQNEKIFMAAQKEYSDRAVNAQIELNTKWRKVMILNPDVLAKFMVMAFGAYQVLHGWMTIGTMFMFMGFLNEILTPLHLLGDILPEYSRRARNIEKFLKLEEQSDSVVDPKRPRKFVPSEVKGKIEFRNVTFVYGSLKDRNADSKDRAESGRKVLNNLSFTIEPGQQVALVGHSGAGKSTVMALLTRLADPTSGEVLLDGVNIKEYRQADYRRILGVVLQEHSLYNETIANNIAYGKPGAKRKEIIEAAGFAAADDFISKLKNGYDTPIGERGVRLSGGEKQRLGIARAILKNPKIVVLDEPTSALDSVTEAKVQKGLQKLIEGRSSMVIAHRLSTVRNADKIIVLGDQRLIAEGTHSELLRSCPEYLEMVELQTKGFLEE